MTLSKSIGICIYPARKFGKKGLPLEAKNLVWETFLENQDVAQRRSPMAFTLIFRMKWVKKAISSIFLGSA